MIISLQRIIVKNSIKIKRKVNQMIILMILMIVFY